MNVSDTVSREKESTEMTTFTIDTDNNLRLRRGCACGTTVGGN
jgi:hypothetical protein